METSTLRRRKKVRTLQMMQGKSEIIEIRISAISTTISSKKNPQSFICYLV